MCKTRLSVARNGRNRIGKWALCCFDSALIIVDTFRQARNDCAHVVDAQILYRRGATFSIYGRNLTKDDGYTIGLDIGRSATFPALWTFVATWPPCTYGVSVSHNF